VGAHLPRPPADAPLAEAGIRTPQVAAAWAERGRSPGEARPWIDHGFSAREAAAWQRDSGLGDEADPAAQAALAAAWRHGRFTPESCANWRVVADDPTVARAWRRLAGWPEAVRPWREVGVDDPAVASRLVAAGAGPTDVDGWARLGGAGIDLVLRWHAWWSPNHAREWCERLGCDLEQAALWRQVAGGRLATACDWQQTGAVTPEAAWSWVEAGYDVDDVGAWIGLGVTDRAEVEAFAAAEIDPGTAGRWRAIGVEPVAQEVTAWSQRLSIDDAERWSETAGAPVQQAWEWVEVTAGDLDAVALWREAEVYDPREAASLASLGVEAAEAAGWAQLGAVGDDTLSWRQRWPLGDASAWCDALGLGLEQSWSWHQQVSIVVWRDRWSLPTASQWSRILECDLGRAWWWHRVANGDLDVATGWHRAEQAAAPAEA